MPMYSYRYLDMTGTRKTSEIGARDIREAAEKVRQRLGRALEFVLWDRDLPAPSVQEWVEGS